MPNQHTHLSLENNCICTHCGNTFHRRPSEINKKNFCSRQCYVKGNFQYSEADKQYVKSNICTLGVKKMAAHLGREEAALRKKITMWRNEGYDIPHARTKPIGHVSYQKDGNKLRKTVKTKDGWVRIPHNDRVVKKSNVVVKKLKTKPINVTPVIKVCNVVSNTNKPKKKEITPLPTRQRTEEMVTIRIDAKTIALVPKSKNVEKVKQLYAR